MNNAEEMKELPFLKALRTVHGPVTVDFKTDDGLEDSITFYYRESIRAPWEEEIRKAYGGDNHSEANMLVMEKTMLKNQMGEFMFDINGANRDVLSNLPNEFIKPIVAKLIELGAMGENMKYIHGAMAKADELQRLSMAKNVEKLEDSIKVVDAQAAADKAVADVKVKSALETVERAEAIKAAVDSDE